MWRSPLLATLILNGEDKSTNMRYVNMYTNMNIFRKYLKRLNINMKIRYMNMYTDI